MTAISIIGDNAWGIELGGSLMSLAMIMRGALERRRRHGDDIEPATEMALHTCLVLQ